MSAVVQSLSVETVDTGAPLVLITGLPGAGKTLYALSEFLKGQKNVYQHGVNGCEFPSWDATKWAELPAGGTLVVDEAQEVFPPRNPTADPPEHYVLNKIRHGGRSMVLITQDAGMLDSRVRRLVGRHIHLVNAFGANASMVYDKRTGLMNTETREGAEADLWKFPVENFKLYKSTVLNRKKRHIPLKVLMIPVLVILAVAGIAGGLWWVRQNMADKVGLKDSGGSGSMFSAPSGSRGEGDRRVLSPLEYVAAAEPRITGLPHTAPKYDATTKTTRAPYPAACVATASRCKCYTQDATSMDVPDATCRSIVAGGFFKDWDDAADQRSQAVGGPLAHVAPVPSSGFASAVAGSPSASDTHQGELVAFARSVGR